MPRWLRAALAAERAAGAVARGVSLLVEEMALAWVPPHRRDAVTAAVYGAQRMYLAGSPHFEQGLFDWESRALAAPEFPRAGRILLGGAGGGREARALASMGYSVIGFDPSVRLVERSATALAGLPATVVHAGYGDLIAAARGEPGPLSDVPRSPPVDAVVLGWASFSHLMAGEQRLALLHATRAIAPAAPLLLSFLAAGGGGEGGRGERARRALRRTFAALGAPGAPRAGDRFVAWGGFLHLLSVEDIRTLAAAAGYRVAIVAASPYGHALLVPTSAGPAAGAAGAAAAARGVP